MSKMTDGSSRQKYWAIPTQVQNGHRDDITVEDVLDDDHSDARAQCSIGGLRCRCLQVFAHPNAFVLCVGLLFMCMIGASGIYVAGVISTIEKRFQLKSSESGFLLSVSDISSLCGVLFVSHFGGKSHRPRIIGISGLVVSIGTFVTALPQFLFDNPVLGELFVSNANQSESTSGAYVYGKEFVCNALVSDVPCTAAEIEASGSQLSKTWPMMLGQLLCGIGHAAILPLSMTYLDDAVKRNIMPIYVALMFLPLTITPLIGYSISGYCLSLFVDFYKTDASKLGITPRDPQWQGAWWLGFIIYGCLLFLFSVPFFFFPKRMSKPRSYCCCSGMPDCCTGLIGRFQDGRGVGGVATKGMSHDKKISSKPMVVIKDFLESLWRLVTNPTYMTSLIGYCMLVLSFAGFGVFAAKYMQFQFGVNPSKAGILLGFVIMPGSLVGIMLGGMLSSMVARNQRGYAVLTLIAHCICALVYVIMMFIGCSNINIAGLTTPYESNRTLSNLDVYATCNTNCMCEKGVYSPVCGSNNVTYVTSCLAGCETLGKDQNGKTIYQDCRCIDPSENTSPGEPTSGFAVHGACATECGSLILFLVFLGISSAISSLSFNPTFMMKFRSVLDKDRDLSLGLSSLMSKTLGFIPAPVILGASIESQCSHWQESCEATGECLLYDRPGLRFVFFGYTAGTRLLTFLCLCISAYFVFKNKYKPEIDEGDEEPVEQTNEIGEMMKATSNKETEV